MGTGVLPPDHPQLLGMIGFWGSPAANRLAAEADVILAVGTRFPETDSSSWEPGVTFGIPPTRLIHVDLDPHEPGRNYPTAIAATADAGLALDGDRARPTASRRRIAGIDWAALREEREAFLAPSRANAASDELPAAPRADPRRSSGGPCPDAILVTDVGWNKNGVAQQYPVDTPDSFLTPGGFSTMGFGPSAVLGVVAAGTDRPAIALVGDGAFGSNPNVVATAVEMGIAPVWVVMNNAAFGTIAGLERKHYGTRLRLRVPRGRRPVLAGLRGHRPRLRSRRRPDRARRRAWSRRSRRRVASGRPTRHRRADAQHAGHDAGCVGHRADLPRRGSADRIR